MVLAAKDDPTISRSHLVAETSVLLVDESWSFIAWEEDLFQELYTM